jgi:hypothetical protein
LTQEYFLLFFFFLNMGHPIQTDIGEALLQLAMAASQSEDEEE